MEGNLEIYQQEDFDFDSIVLRRADPDDCDQIINLVEIGKDDVYNRVYSYPKILKLIETAYLSITVLDREGRVVAFAAFEDYPQGMRGMYDERHYNCWESWFKKGFQVEEFGPFNTLWLTYFIAGGSISYRDQKFAFKKILQTVYTSIAETNGGDADEDDINYCFEPLKEYFEEIVCNEREVLKDVRGIHFNSRVFFSSRVLVLPFIEIRTARQEDHDDLADVFNSQSETITEAYGEYFIAELIAAQNDDNKALVAQVKDKAVGLMGLTSEVDVKLLHECFELDAFDNLLKPEFMNAVRQRREHILEQNRKEEEEKRIAELKQLKEETMMCNIIAQRIELQEHLIKQDTEISQKLEDILSAENEDIKSLDRPAVERIFDEWLSGFELRQPSSYFLKHQTDDYELVCNIQSEREFLLSTLEIFGLPENYIEGLGHFPNWGKDKKDDKQAAVTKRMLAAKNKNKKTGGIMERMRKERGLDNKKEEDKKPTHFDLQPFQQAFKRFVVCNGEARSKLRQDLKQELVTVKKVFVDQYNEPSFKKCVNIQDFGKELAAKGVNINPTIVDKIGPLLICFGDIQFEMVQIERMPEETEEEKRAVALKKIKEEQEKKAAEGGDDKKKGKKEDKKKQAEKEKQQEEEEKKEEKKEPPKPIKVWLYQTSIHDLLLSLDKMAEYDFVMNELGIMQADITEEQQKLGREPNQLGSAQSKVRAKQSSYTNAQGRYSDDDDYHKLVSYIEDLDEIPEPLEKAKNAFAITLFCMEAAFDSRSKDFLKYAFELFPDRDYLVVTQPHTVSENSLLQKFTLAQKKPQNTFTHVLYLIHRDSLLEQDLYVERAVKDDLDKVKGLAEQLDERQHMHDTMYEAIVNPDSSNLAFVARIDDEVVGAFVLAKDVNLEYYRSHFHIQDSILLNEHERKGHTRLIYSVINPIFEKSTRFMLKELLRLSANTCMYFEIHTKTVIPTIFHELIHVRSRRFPHFLDKKWDHERYVSEDQALEDDKDQMIRPDGHDRDPMDELESPFALCFTTKRLLSEPKIVKNSRIVVVGASDTGISFIEALLSISYLRFTNIILIAPGGLPHHHFDSKDYNLKAYSTSYTQQELKRLMLETRVRVINSRMIDIDRRDKYIILQDSKIVNYDTLILTMGIQDNTLKCLGYVSRGIAPIKSELKEKKTFENEGAAQGEDNDKKYVEGLISIDDPFLYQHLRTGGSIMNMLTNRKRPQNCVIYGRTLHAYTCIQGLLARGVKAEQITYVIPGKACHVSEIYDEEEEMDVDLPVINPPAFPDEYIESKIQKMIEAKGIRIVNNALLIQILEDEENKIDSVLFKLLDIPDEEEEEEELVDGMADRSEQESKHSQSHLDGGDTYEDDEKSKQEEQVVQKKKRKKNELELFCKVLITCGHRDVDQDVFNAIHISGLVYNGRMIVDKNFQTTDPSIFAAGSLCEFSGRYKSLSQGRPLRMDRYNGREMGSRLARSVFDIYDPSLGNAADPSNLEDELPTFYLPQGQGGVLPNGIIYYHIKTTNPLLLAKGYVESKNRKELICDNLNDETRKGQFIKFTFNSIGLIDSVTYMGNEEVVLQSLWSFVGLHENYLNNLTSRYERGIIPNVSEFLSENWAIALYHEWFGDFCLRMRQSIQGLKDIQIILEKAFEMTKNGEGIQREQFDELRKMMDARTVKMIEDETLEFIKTNMNHLPMYYIPGEEQFP